MKKLFKTIPLLLFAMFSTTNVVLADKRSNIENPKGIIEENYYSCGYDAGQLVKVPQMKVEYEYQNGVVSAETYNMYDTTKEEYIPNFRYEYVYNENGDISNFVEKNYNATSQTFEIIDEEVYEYNAANKLLKHTDYKFDNGTKYTAYLKEYTYDQDNVLTMYTVKNSSSATDDLTLTSKHAYEYTQGLLTKDSYYYKSSTELVIRETFEYTYDANNNVTQEFATEYSYDGTSIDGYYQKNKTYDAQNRVILEMRYEQRYDFATKNLTEKSKYEFSYDGNTVTEIYYSKNSVEFVIEYKEVITKSAGFYQNDYYEYNEGQYTLDDSCKEVAIYENGKMIAVEGYELDGTEYAMVSYHDFVYPQTPVTPNNKKGNAGVTILVIILILILLFVVAYVIWKLELEEKIKFKENDRIMKFADVVYKPIDNFIFGKVFKKKQ